MPTCASTCTTASPRRRCQYPAACLCSCRAAATTQLSRSRLRQAAAAGAQLPRLPTAAAVASPAQAVIAFACILTGLPVDAEAAAAAAAALRRASRLTHEKLDSKLERLLNYSTGEYRHRCVSQDSLPEKPQDEPALEAVLRGASQHSPQ